MGARAGRDSGWGSRKDHGGTGRPESRVADGLCELGRFGQKTGAGWYAYDEGGRAAQPDPLVEEHILSASKDLGMTRRSIGDEEILARCLYPLINEGARILEEGIAARAGDIDIIWINGYAYPAHRGGPLFHADQIGLGKVYETIGEFHRTHGDAWEPAPLLRERAAAGRGFGDL